MVREAGDAAGERPSEDARCGGVETELDAVAIRPRRIARSREKHLRFIRQTGIAALTRQQKKLARVMLHLRYIRPDSCALRMLQDQGVRAGAIAQHVRLHAKVRQPSAMMV